LYTTFNVKISPAAEIHGVYKCIFAYDSVYDLVYDSVYDSVYDLLPKVLRKLIFDFFPEMCRQTIHCKGCQMKNWIPIWLACKSRIKSYAESYTHSYTCRRPLTLGKLFGSDIWQPDENL
jgi:hypothetical protein